MEQLSIVAERARRKYELEGRLFRLSGREKFLTGEIQAVQAGLYQAKADLLEHEAPSLTRLLTKNTAKYEEKTANLRRTVRDCEARLVRLTSEQKSLLKLRAESEQELSTLAGCEEALEKAGGTPEQVCRLRSSFHCAKALAMLEDSLRALTAWRDMLYGKLPQPMSREERWAVEAEANTMGEKCREVLEHLARDLGQLNIPFSLTGYYANPHSYIISAAAEHNRRERLSLAIGQAAQYRRQLQEILAGLEE